MGHRLRMALSVLLAGVATSASGAVAAEEVTARMVFVRGIDDAVWFRRLDVDGSWEPWVSLGGITTGQPSAISWYYQDFAAPGPVRVYVRGWDGALWERRTVDNGATWSPWVSWGGMLTSDPVAAIGRTSHPPPVPGMNNSWVAARGNDGLVWATTGPSQFGPAVWRPATDRVVDGGFSAVAVATVPEDTVQVVGLSPSNDIVSGRVGTTGGGVQVSPGPLAVRDIMYEPDRGTFVVAADGTLLRASSDPALPWSAVGGRVRTVPVPGPPGRLAVTGADRHVWVIDAVGTWNDVGGLTDDEPAYASVDPCCGEVLAVRGVDDALWVRSSDSDGTIGPWTSLGGLLAGPPVLSHQ